MRFRHVVIYDDAHHPWFKRLWFGLRYGKFWRLKAFVNLEQEK